MVHSTFCVILSRLCKKDVKWDPEYLMPESLKLHFGQTVKGSYIYGISFPSMSYDSIPTYMRRYGHGMAYIKGPSLDKAWALQDKHLAVECIQVNDVSNGHHSIDTVDGSHPLVGSLSLYLQGLIHPRWCRISSVNSIMLGWRLALGTFQPSGLSQPKTRGSNKKQSCGSCWAFSTVASLKRHKALPMALRALVATNSWYALSRFTLDDPFIMQWIHRSLLPMDELPISRFFWYSLDQNLSVAIQHLMVHRYPCQIKAISIMPCVLQQVQVQLIIGHSPNSLAGET